MSRPQLTPEQQKSLRIADASGRALVTMIDGRVAIILPRCPTDEATADLIARAGDALAAAGLARD